MKADLKVSLIFVFVIAYFAWQSGFLFARFPFNLTYCKITDQIASSLVLLAMTKEGAGIALGMTKMNGILLVA